MTFTAGENLNINVGQNMTTHVGMNKTDTVIMNTTESTGMMKSTTIGADANMMIMGSLMEFIKGDLKSDVTKERSDSASEVTVTSNTGSVNHNAKSKVQNNSGEKGNNF